MKLFILIIMQRIMANNLFYPKLGLVLEEINPKRLILNTGTKDIQLALEYKYPSKTNQIIDSLSQCNLDNTAKEKIITATNDAIKILNKEIKYESVRMKRTMWKNVISERIRERKMGWSFVQKFKSLSRF